jgi:hypothetical protein
MPPEAEPQTAVGGCSLVLDGQRSTTPAQWCQVGPLNEGLRIVTPDGHFFRVPCKRRDCARCWARRSRELARCLLLDARAQMPTHCLTLTTRTPWEQLDPQVYRHGSHMVFRRLRRAVGATEYFGAIEFTTGRAERSGGRRRLHGHYLLKFPGRVVDVLQVERLVRETWEHTTGAWIVEVAELISPGAALGYLGLHHRKASQAPPVNWRGMTERSSSAYWSRPIGELRLQARHELAAEALAERSGLPYAVASLEVASREPGRLIQTSRRGDSPLLVPHVAWKPSRDK